MPSSTPKQHRFMEMVAHSPSAARRVGVPQSVGQDFVQADVGTPIAHAPVPPRRAKQRALMEALKGRGR